MKMPPIFAMGGIVQKAEYLDSKGKSRQFHNLAT
jgi:hypothetical protein